MSRPSDGRRLFIGTAGWSIPRIHAEHFALEGTHLERYARVFSAAEINTSFYRPHRRSTYERWAASAPDHFRFSVKAPKAVTHADWRDPCAILDSFFDEVAGLGAKLGPILIQLPPKRVFAADEATRFLAAFRQRTNGLIALEPRHASWFEPDVEEILRGLKIARVAADPPRGEGADRPGGCTALVYFRLHGSPQTYRSSYGEKRLMGIARHVRAPTSSGSEAWCVFDNTTSYAATGDALALLRIMKSD